MIAPIVASYVDARARCTNITTVRKRDLEVSSGAGLAIFDPITGTLVLRNAEDCIGYLLPSVRQEPCMGTGFCRDLGWWYGVLVADGWFRPTMIGYAKNDRDKREEFVRITRKYFDAEFSLHEYHDDGTASNKFAESTKLHLFSRPLREAVLNCYCPRGEGRGALYKKIPDELLTYGSRDCLLGLLAGLLEGDSTLGWGRSKRRPQAVCRNNTSSWCLVTGLQRLGRLLGIRNSVTTTAAKGRSNESYCLNWSLPDMLPIVTELRFVSEEARQWQAEFLNAPPVTDNIDIVPITTDLAKHFAPLLLRQGETHLYDVCRQAKSTYYMTRHSARRVLQFTRTDQGMKTARLAFEQIVHNEAIHWDRVKHVFQGETQTVYGLAVPSTGVFMVQNGLIVPAASGMNRRTR